VNEYQKRDGRLRVAFERSRGCTDVDSIARAAGCSLGDAWRIHIVREHASGVLLDAWAHERIAWGKLWQLVSDHPFDTEAQVRASKQRRSPKKTTSPRVTVIDEHATT
jgi:hypothetical protein